MTSYSSCETIDPLLFIHGNSWTHVDSQPKQHRWQDVLLSHIFFCAISAMHYTVHNVTCDQCWTFQPFTTCRAQLPSSSLVCFVPRWQHMWAKDISDIRMISDRVQLHKADKCLCSHAHKRQWFVGPETTHRTIPALAQKLQIWSSKWSSRVSRGNGPMHWCCGGVGIQGWECNRAARYMCMHGPFLSWLAVDSYDVQLY